MTNQDFRRHCWSLVLGHWSFSLSPPAPLRDHPVDAEVPRPVRAWPDAEVAVGVAVGADVEVLPCGLTRLAVRAGRFRLTEQEVRRRTGVGGRSKGGGQGERAEKIAHGRAGIRRVATGKESGVFGGISLSKMESVTRQRLPTPYRFYRFGWLVSLTAVESWAM